MPRNIVLLSDGTGNSAAKLFKTNVWRLYEALDLSYPYAAQMMNRIGRERGWQPMRREDWDASATLHGANFVGSPQQVIEKILFQEEIFHHDRFLLQISIGGLPHAAMMRAIELYGSEVAPAVRKELAGRAATPAASAQSEPS